MESAAGKLLKLRPEDSERKPLIQEIKDIKKEEEPESVPGVALPESLKS
jgi:hypothetical protein